MGFVVVDLETVPIEDAAAYIESVTAPGNYKDPDKIAAYVAEKHAERTLRAALDPELARIVALGWLMDGQLRIYTCVDEDAERDVLRVFWRTLGIDRHGTEMTRLIGFNSFSFDLPVLMRRSRFLGVAAPRLSVQRHSSPHIDLLQELTYQGATPMHSLQFCARRRGLPIDEPDITGSMVARLVAAGRLGEVAAHCVSDVRVTAALARWCGYDVPEQIALDAVV